LSELINKIGDRNSKLIELIITNPVSKLKLTSKLKTNLGSSEFYFDTDNIMSLKNDNSQAVYIIPAYKSSNARDNNIYSISININENFIDTKLNILEIKSDGTQEYNSTDFGFSTSKSKTSKVKDIECYCTVTISDCTCCSSHADGGCNHPITNIYCGACVGALTSGTSVGTNTGTNSTISTVWASSSSYGYTYNLTGSSIYIGLTKKYNPDYMFSSLQKFNIINSPEISGSLLDFLNTDGNSQSNKNFGVSIFDAIEEGTVNNYQEFSLLLNVYKEVQVFLAFKNNYFIEHPSTTVEQFENWFMGKPEGSENLDVRDSDFWNDPNLSFPQQNLPSFDDFKNACPSKSTSASTLCNTIGGEILTLYNNIVVQGKKMNTCSIRISRALNYSGITIPNVPGTKLGSDGKYYFTFANDLNKWMRLTFGVNPSNLKHIRITVTQGGINGVNFPNYIKGKKGIYTMVAKSEILDTWGTGHADLLENDTCRLDCHFYDINNHFVPVDYIDIWILE